MRAAPRGRVCPTRWGCSTSLGNQWEECWGMYPMRPQGFVIDPSERSPPHSCVKGGSASAGLFYLEASYHAAVPPTNPAGFRVVCGPEGRVAERGDRAAALAAVARFLKAIRLIAGSARCANPCSPTFSHEVLRDAETILAHDPRALPDRALRSPREPRPRTSGWKSVRSGAKAARSSRTGAAEGARVVGVKIRHGRWIDGIELIYRTADGEEEGLGWHGGDGGEEEMFRLGEGEYITGMTGEGRMYIDSLTIVTDERNPGPTAGTARYHLRPSELLRGGHGAFRPFGTVSRSDRIFAQETALRRATRRS